VIARAIFCMRRCTKQGFANQPTSLHRDDSLQLKNAYVSATCRCAPPDNKPLPKQISIAEVILKANWRFAAQAVLALGKIAWDTYLEILKLRGMIESHGLYKFAHGAEAEVAA